jgi:hypothetical protein
MEAFRSALGVGVCLLLCGCGHLTPALRGDDCIADIVNAVEAAPEERAIRTLDGQVVDLEEFFFLSDRHPRCALYRKFYLWRSAVITTESPSHDGRVRHRVRAYYSPSSVCHPERVHPGRIYGDVAEFYDANGEFMGLAVYMGEGLYCPLAYSGYSNARKAAPFRLQYSF